MADQTFNPKRQAALESNLAKAKSGDITRKDVTDSLRKVESDQYRVDESIRKYKRDNRGRISAISDKAQSSKDLERQIERERNAPFANPNSETIRHANTLLQLYKHKEDLEESERAHKVLLEKGQFKFKTDKSAAFKQQHQPKKPAEPTPPALAKENYPKSRGLVEFGKVKQPAGKDGAYFRDITVVNASPETVRAFEDYGATHSVRGDIHTFEFRGNTESAVGITGKVPEQILHLSGHEPHPEAFEYTDAQETKELYGSYRPFGGERAPKPPSQYYGGQVHDMALTNQVNAKIDAQGRIPPKMTPEQMDRLKAQQEAYRKSAEGQAFKRELAQHHKETAKLTDAQIDAEAAKQQAARKEGEPKQELNYTRSSRGTGSGRTAKPKPASRQPEAASAPAKHIAPSGDNRKEQGKKGKYNGKGGFSSDEQRKAVFAKLAAEGKLKKRDKK